MARTKSKSSAVKNRRRGAALESKYRRWGRIASAAQSKAAEAIHPKTTQAELKAAVVEFAREMERIPAPVLAMESAMQECEQLVETLAGAGVRFASRKNAPAQLAASAYAGWISCHARPITNPAEWMAVLACLVLGVEHALKDGTGTPPGFREAVLQTAAKPAARGRAASNRKPK